MARPRVLVLLATMVALALAGCWAMEPFSELGDPCHTDTICVGELHCCDDDTCHECCGDYDCDTGEECVYHVCVEPEVECVDDADCDPGDTCVDDQCVPFECATHGDCDGGECVDGQCVEAEPECTDNEGCDEEFECENGICVCGQDCCDDRDCAEGLLCDLGECVECSVDADCPGELRCFGNVCAECATDEDCPADKWCDGGECTAYQDATVVISGEPGQEFWVISLLGLPDSWDRIKDELNACSDPNVMQAVHDRITAAGMADANGSCSFTLSTTGSSAILTRTLGDPTSPSGICGFVGSDPFHITRELLEGGGEIQLGEVELLFQCTPGCG